ncbi:MAG: winged helix-turn-helix transcriptional regulator, partial [Oscillospiraceae bacterium]|nr:winged helix-turn-helix transcriptional regulator [Oscillospiraceae bacterium]
RGKPESVRTELEWRGLRVSQDSNMVWRGERELDLTDTEWRILRLLLKNRGKIFSMANIYESVWDEPYFSSSSNTIMVHIRRLREKIEDDPCHPEFIKTVWGKGYRVG